MYIREDIKILHTRLRQNGTYTDIINSIGVLTIRPIDPTRYFI